VLVVGDYSQNNKYDWQIGQLLQKLAGSRSQTPISRIDAKMDAALISPFSIFVIVIVLMAVILVFLGVKTVPQGFEFTIERFGKYTRSLRPGLNLIVPVIDKGGQEFNMMEQVLDGPAQEISTRDNAMVTVDGVVC